jgi:hypothetical protein
MDPTQYQQLMIQNLMRPNPQGSFAQGANPTSQYGQSFLTGNQTRPVTPGVGAGMYGMGMAGSLQGGQSVASPPQSSTPAYNPYQLQQPYAGYTGTATTS